MDFTFLKATGEVAFFRSDAEQAEWTQEELSLLCTFPFDSGKVIERGMIVLFQDPATGDNHAYEVRNCAMYPGESYQQFTAESLAISELTDCHIADDIELTNTSASAALSRILSGTGWQIGNVAENPVSFGDIGRGSVWQGVSTIRNNWNVYIEPRVTVDSTGITGRFLDILSTKGVWRGVRLAIDKNITDPSVIYDDSELYTALYGYGGSYSVGEREQRETKETNFASVTWQATADHPAKPQGQTYIEDPAKTAAYGRNGKPRFGYYQNTDIKDPAVLLQKTWESLQACYEPKININGTVTDLKRLGYNDEPLRLHDMAIVDLNPVGIQLYRQIIQLTVNLLDPTGNRPVIGDYIPNIIYINRETEDFATGGGKGRGGGGGGGGSTRSAKQKGEFETNILQNERNIELNAKQLDTHGNILRQAGMFIDPITGVLIYAEDTQNMIGSKFHVQSDRITAEVNARTTQGNQLSSRITQEANRITLEVNERKAQGSQLSSRITQTANAITAEVEARSAQGYQLNSKIEQTATQIRSEVTNSEAGLQSQITQNANSITAEVTARTAQGTQLNSKIEQTATQIRSEVTNSEAGLQSQITQNAGSISAEVTRATAAEGTLSSNITVNANAITAEVTRATTEEGSLSSRITVNAQGIETKVSKNGVISSINQTAETIKIQAAKINLDGYVTQSQMEAGFASIDQTTIRILTNSGNAYFNGGFYVNGDSLSIKSATVRKYDLSTEHYFLYGTTSSADGTARGKIVIGNSSTTIHYLGY